MKKSVFWDKMGKIDRDKDMVYVIIKVINYGDEKDFDLIKKKYGISQILEISLKNQDQLDEWSKNYLNIKYGLSLKLNKKTDVINSGYSPRYQEDVFVG